MCPCIAFLQANPAFNLCESTLPVPNIRRVENKIANTIAPWRLTISPIAVKHFLQHEQSWTKPKAMNMNLPWMFVETENDVFRWLTGAPLISMIVTRDHSNEILQVLFHCIPERSILSYIHRIDCGLDGTRATEWVGWVIWAYWYTERDHEKKSEHTIQTWILLGSDSALNSCHIVPS